MCDTRDDPQSGGFLLGFPRFKVNQGVPTPKQPAHTFPSSETAGPSAGLNLLLLRQRLVGNGIDLPTEAAKAARRQREKIESPLRRFRVAASMSCDRG